MDKLKKSAIEADQVLRGQLETAVLSCVLQIQRITYLRDVASASSYKKFRVDAPHFWLDVVVRALPGQKVCCDRVQNENHGNAV
jgi:hypothetical protein